MIESSKLVSSENKQQRNDQVTGERNEPPKQTGCYKGKTENAECRNADTRG